jgi:light-regulated signal transduction histidine kinase (bacteriophytochrome)
MGKCEQDRLEDEVKRLRQALDSETQQSITLQRRLDRANAAFEEFVSTAAHNLRESLREVASFSQLLAETAAGRLDPGAGEFLDRILEGAARMQSLLTGMVDYWAADAADRKTVRTDMEAVLRQALLCADKQIAGRGAVITHGPLPAVMGDFELLTTALRHLIVNAIEYCDKPSPSVHVSAKPVDLDVLFSVEDNGPGIDAEFRDRVFGAFQRLHGREHPGNGLGLAFCKKAVEWHGGRIWMEPAPGEGSIFHFTLPAAD